MILTVLDIGGGLERPRADAAARLGTQRPANWNGRDLRRIVELPATSAVQGLPEKRSYGSDFPFRDFGQLADVHAHEAVNPSMISGAYGGFSTVWGAQVMPFSRATLRTWPFTFDVLAPHYRSVLREVPFTAEHDDLASTFPLLADAHPLPPLSGRTVRVLNRYERHRDRLRRAGVSMGRARLAMHASSCVLCGLCLTGCPYHLVYAASQTLDRFRKAQRITYHSRLLVTHIEERREHVIVTARDLDRDTTESFTADRVYVACGGVGTARLVMSSLQLFDQPLQLLESAQFMLPFLSRSATADPRPYRRFTLNQFNMLIDLARNEYDLAHLHFYTYNEAFVTALPSLLKRHRLDSLRAHLLRHLSVALGYLPSWHSPSLNITATPSATRSELAPISIRADSADYLRNHALRRVLAMVTKAAPALDLWPLLPVLDLPARGKSYHWGGTFPHSAIDQRQVSTDLLGRVRPLKRVHLIDGSVLPSIAATTFTLTVMANAHRIVTATLDGHS